MSVYAIDFETFYTEDYGIEEVGLWHYLNDPRFDPYLVSIYGPGVDYVGHPDNAPWAKVYGHVWVSHNSSFDRQVWHRWAFLKSGGLIHPDNWSAWYCTANMSVYIGGPRSLKDAAKHLLSKEVDKGMRNYMKGKTWAQAVAEGRDKALMEYARQDSINCWELWTNYSERWPQSERDLAELTFQQTVRGIAVDRTLVEATLPPVFEAKEKAIKLIPWYGKTDYKGEEIPALSSLALKAWCADNDVPVPITTNAKDLRFMEWQKLNGDVSVVKAMQTYRSANALFMKGNTLYQRIRNDGRYGFEMKYFGATTGRWSGGYEDEHSDSAKFNIQNMPKEAMFGFDLRRCLIPAKGKKFVIADYSQIEPRCLAILSGDTAMLKSLYKKIGLYEAHARATMEWKGGIMKDEDKKMYALAKARVLALGYQCGWAKFIVMAYMYGVQDVLDFPIIDFLKNKAQFEKYLDRFAQRDKMKTNPTEKDWTQAINAWLIVMDFRATNEPITNLWKRLEHDCRRAVGTDYVVELPSGRLLKYFNVKIVAGKLMVQKQLHEPHIAVWGGFLCENITQAFARDVLAHAMLKMEANGIQTLFTAHDEVISEVDINLNNADIKNLMIEPPSWAADLPLDVSIEDSDYYKK